MIDTQNLRVLAMTIEERERVAASWIRAAANIIDAQAAEIARLREAISESIRMLGMDRPTNPTDVLRAALSGEQNG